MNQKQLDEMIDRAIDDGQDGIDVGALHPLGWQEPADALDTLRVVASVRQVACRCRPRRHPTYKSMARCAFPTARVHGNGRWALVELKRGEGTVWLRHTERAIGLLALRRDLNGDPADVRWIVELDHRHIR